MTAHQVGRPLIPVQCGDPGPETVATCCPPFPQSQPAPGDLRDWRPLHLAWPFLTETASFFLRSLPAACAGARTAHNWRKPSFEKMKRENVGKPLPQPGQPPQTQITERQLTLHQGTHLSTQPATPSCPRQGPGLDLYPRVVVSDEGQDTGFPVPQGHLLGTGLGRLPGS